MLSLIKEQEALVRIMLKAGKAMFSDEDIAKRVCRSERWIRKLRARLYMGVDLVIKQNYNSAAKLCDYYMHVSLLLFLLYLCYKDGNLILI